MTDSPTANQVTYPQKLSTAERTPAKEAELQAVLDTVGVGYLIPRWKDDMSHEVFRNA
jgi:hypothetical protein